MIEKHYPSHVEGWVRDASALFPDQADDYHYFYQLVCPCGGKQFRARLSNQESLKVECGGCKREIVVYDLALYPAATKERGVEEFQLVRQAEFTGEEQVFVMYEYGQLDEDQPFDRNDITWCQAWLENSLGKRVMILDDETA